LLQLSGMILLDHVQLKSRQTSLLGNACKVQIAWPGPGAISCFYVFWLAYILLSFARDVVGHAGPHLHALSSSSWEIALGTWEAGFLLAILAAIRFRRRARVLGEFRVLRGILKATVKDFSQKSKFFGLLDAPLFVIPDADFVEVCARMGSGIAIPLRLLDSLSRREIDALAARQLCVQSRKFYFPLLWILLACNVVVVFIVQWFQGALLYAFLLYLSLLTLEFFALSRSLPRIFFQTDLQAIQLTGDAEAFFSAIGALSRFSGAPLQEPTLREIGRQTAVSPDRIKILVAEHETKAEDRYPTSGSYFDTGF
jgi:hypothetical protein